MYLNIYKVDSMDKILLDFKEVCEYLGLGQTKVREILHNNTTFTVKIGNRLYAKKDLLDKHIEKCIRYNIPL